MTQPGQSIEKGFKSPLEPFTLSAFLDKTLGEKATDGASRDQLAKDVVAHLHSGRNTPGHIYFEPIVTPEGQKDSKLKFKVFEKEDRVDDPSLDVSLGEIIVTPEEIEKYTTPIV